MYSVIFTSQIIAVGLSAASILLLTFKKPNPYSSIMLLAFVCGLFQNVGYLLEVIAYDVNSAMLAVKVEYIGAAFIISLITIFIFRYCDKKLPKGLELIFLVEGIFVVLGVWSYERNDMYYTSVDFVKDNVFPHLVLGHGWLYLLFAITVLSELIICIFIILISLIKTKEKNMRRNFIILLVVVITPLLGYVTAVTGSLNGYDPTPLSISFAIALFGFAIAKNHVFDIAGTASETIIENLNDAIIVVNNENGYEGSNLRAKELYPYLYDVRHGEIITDSAVTQLFDTSGSNEVTINNHIYNVHINPVMVKGRNIGRTAVLFDVTENKLQLEKMREIMTEADKANSAKSDFIANVSHEIRTPINVVLGMSEVLLRDYANKETDEYVLNIRKSANTLLSLINDILDFSKIEAGKMEIIENEYDVKQLIQEIISVYQFRCEKKGLKFKTEVPENLPRYLIGDTVRTKQILNNLLSNAVKYTENGEVRFKVTYKVRSDYEMDVIIAVEDTGIGIRREEQSKIFQGFSRLDPKKTSHIQGTGLGLNITKQLVTLMHGAVNFKSDYEKGSVFTVVIPQKISTNARETIGNINDSVVNEKVYSADFIAPDAKVLIVDDTITNLIVAKELIKKTEIQVTTATSGEKCLELCRDNHYDIIFLDHRMPGMDGIETFSRLKQSVNECSDTPVIMLTANAIGDARNYYLSKSFTDFLSKPISSQQLIELILKYLPSEYVHKKDSTN